VVSLILTVEVDIIGASDMPKQRFLANWNELMQLTVLQ